MSDGQSGENDQQVGPGRRIRAWRWFRREARFVADTVHPSSAGLTGGRRLATWTIVLISLGVAVVAGAVVATAIHFLTAPTEVRIDDKAGDALDAEKGYIHASIRPQPYGSYAPSFSAFSKTRLTPSQIRGVDRGEYGSDILENPVGGVGFYRADGDKLNHGQVYFVNLTSDSNAMLTVIDIDAVNIRCRESEMIAEIHVPSEGEVQIISVAYRLQDRLGTQNGFISDPDDSNFGKQYFNHRTIVLGGGAEHQTLSVLGVANAGSYCEWDLQARFITDDGKEHRKKLNAKPLISDGGPGRGPGTQHRVIDLSKVILWGCKHGLRDPTDCLGMPGFS